MLFLAGLIFYACKLVLNIDISLVNKAQKLRHERLPYLNTAFTVAFISIWLRFIDETGNVFVQYIIFGLFRIMFKYIKYIHLFYI